MNINDSIKNYLAAKAEQTAAEKIAREAKKRADMAADEILRAAAGRSSFETDAYTVGIKTRVSIVLDTEKLYRDFRDIKNLDQYGRESPRTTIEAIAKQAEAIGA